jgi:CRISPR-associated protein Csm4
MQLDTWNITGSGFHFGQQGLGQEATSITLSSDSLFAALLARLVVTEGQAAVAALIKHFFQEPPPFVLSSTFPYIGGVRLFPVPNRQGGGSTRHKDLKKVRYISEGLFRQMCAGAALGDFYEKSIRLQKNQVLVSEVEAKDLPLAVRSQTLPIWDVEQRPRVKIGRGVQNSTIYFTGRVTFAPECGLWFAVGWHSTQPDLKLILAKLLADLGQAGLGGERSAGFGACYIQPSSSIDLPAPGDGLWVTLSRYIPRFDEMEVLKHPAASYLVETVGGWLGSPVSSGQRRRMAAMLVEGSILGPVSRLVPGQMVDVRPSYPTQVDPLGHPVYRSGLALAVGMQGGSV